MQALGVPEEGGRLYEVALTHRSFAYEQLTPTEHNERLELLGDSILGAIVTTLIYRSYPDLAEGDMARLRASVVNTSALADVARSLDLGSMIRVGKGEEASGGRDKISLLADTFEALVGAVYMEQGFEAVEEALIPVFSERVADAAAATERYDAKTALQEVSVKEHASVPSYRVSSSGPDHDKRFSAHVYLEDELYGSGEGRSKKEAEQLAAKEALARIASESAARPERGSHARAS